jgi:hypothetical protein
MYVYKDIILGVKSRGWGMNFGVLNHTIVSTQHT